MKILFCIDNLKKGGAERVLSIIANNFCKSYDVSIMILNEKIMYDLDERINIIRLDNETSKRKRGYHKLIRIFNRIFKMKQYLKNENYDIIVSFLPEMSFLASFCKGKKNKLIISDRNDPNMEYNSKLYYHLMKKLYPRADGFIFQTPDAKRYFDSLINFSKKKWSIIENPIKEEFICERYKGKRIKEIVSVGRLQEQKNFELLIKAFSKIEKKHVDYKLKIYGEGELRTKLQNLIVDLKLEDKILLCGQKDNIKEEIYKSKLFIMTSNYEGIPNALIEAMCLGLLVISTDCPCGGPKLFIDNGFNGYLIPVNDEKCLVETIDKALSDDKKSEELGNNASKIGARVHPKIIIKKWENFINEVIKLDE